MSTYAVARLRDVIIGPEIVRYLQEIDSTLEFFGGRFKVHGGDFELLEGDWSGDLIIIEFPDRVRARAWYASPAYRRILPLRTNNSCGDVILIDAVPDSHRAADVLVRTQAERQPGR